MIEGVLFMKIRRCVGCLHKNIDENPMTPSKFGVRGIPTLILFKDGKPVSTKVGSMPKSRILEWINSAI